MSDLKAYAVGDSDVYAARSAQQALYLANNTCDSVQDDPTFTMDDVILLTDADLDKEYPEFDENEVATGDTTTIRFWLNQMREPDWICGSEW